MSASPDPAEDIAKVVQEALRDGSDDPAWPDLTDEQRQDEVYLAQHYLLAHINWLGQRGFKVIPPGAVPVPKTDDEAMALVQTAKAYFDGKKRKGQLVNTVAPRKLILPGAH